MRGSHKLAVGSVTETGIIPAHAGLTGPIILAPRRTRDHPRACGAHACCRSASIYSLGSSPRMRGSRRQKDLLFASRGIIPAHAGLTAASGNSAMAARDHPRACGAHQMTDTRQCFRWGSSPRMRGSRNLILRRLVHAGIIPAHAGLTCVDGNGMQGAGDHPRACGAHEHWLRTGDGPMGSSPRMRGSHRRKK